MAAGPCTRDEKIFVWDTRSGNIVASGKSAPKETKAVTFSGGVEGGREGGTELCFSTKGAFTLHSGCFMSHRSVLTAAPTAVTACMITKVSYTSVTKPLHVRKWSE